MLTMVDTAVVAEGEVLPMYAFVLAANSSVLRDVLASQKQDSKTTVGKISAKIPLICDSKASVLAALRYLYQKSVHGKAPAAISDALETQAVAEFGKKYDVAVLMEAADDFLTDYLSTQFKSLQDTPFSQQRGHVRPTQSDDKLLQKAKIAVSWAVCAEENSLQKLLTYSEELLAHVFSLLPACRAEYSSLTKACCG